MKKTKKILCFLLVAVFLFGMTAVTASAEEGTITFDVVETAEPTADEVHDIEGIYNFTANGDARIGMITAVELKGDVKSDGLHITIYTKANETATTIGVKDVIVQKKVSFGWQNVATSAGSAASNSSIYSGSAVVAGLEPGETYRIICIHYAYLSNGYTQVPNQTNEFIY